VQATCRKGVYSPPGILSAFGHIRRFRALAPAVQEDETLKKVYDFMDLEDIREAVAELERERV
jgi:hypothetical protein